MILSSLRRRLGEKPPLQTLYQPVWDLRGPPHLFGVEALTRGPEEGDLHAAADLFGAARDPDDLTWLEWLALEAAVARLPRLGLPCEPRLMLKVNASTLEADRAFPERLLELLEAHRLPPSRVLLEVVGEESADEPPLLGRAFHLLRRARLEIALDNVGLGHAEQRRVLALRPHYLKLDRVLLSHVTSDRPLRTLVASFAFFSRLAGCRIIAEGIETPDQLQAVTGLGLPLGQGYLLGRPRPAEELLTCGAAGGLCTARGPGCPGDPWRTEADLPAPAHGGG